MVRLPYFIAKCFWAEVNCILTSSDISNMCVYVHSLCYVSILGVSEEGEWVISRDNEGEVQGGDEQLEEFKGEL